MTTKQVCFMALAMLLLVGNAIIAQPPRDTTPQPLPIVSPIFGDNAVLQRGKPNTIWGWSDPGDKITVEIAGKSATAVAGSDHRWQAKFDPPPTGGPYTLKITVHQTAELKNVMVGDVWLCSGQSNMQFALRGAKNSSDEIKAANYPEIQFFTVGGGAAYHPLDVPVGSWRVVSPDTAAGVSAVAYYFARKVQSETHIPIGLIVDAVGGTRHRPGPAPEFWRISRISTFPWLR